MNSEKMSDQLVPERTMQHKRERGPISTYTMLFLLLVGMLAAMPLFATLSDLFTRIVISFKGYWVIREIVVPFEIKIVGMLLQLLGFSVSANKEYVVINASSGRDPFFAEIVWNCIGWQSFIFFILTVIIAFGGERYSLWSKIKALLVGSLGTFWINILRIVLIIIVAHVLGAFWGTIVHDYLSNLIQMGWLFFFWWFSYTYILEK